MCLLPLPVVYSQKHQQFRDFVKSDMEAVRNRLTYPVAFFKAIEDIAKESYKGKVDEQAFKDYYRKGFEASQAPLNHPR